MFRSSLSVTWSTDRPRGSGDVVFFIQPVLHSAHYHSTYHHSTFGYYSTCHPGTLTTFSYDSPVRCTFPSSSTKRFSSPYHTIHLFLSPCTSYLGLIDRSSLHGRKRLSPGRPRRCDQPLGYSQQDRTLTLDHQAAVGYAGGEA